MGDTTELIPVERAADDDDLIEFAVRLGQAGGWGEEDVWPMFARIEADRERIKAKDEALKTVIKMLSEWGVGEPMYGPFPGGDVRDFDPDPECSTEEERENHRKACEAANAGMVWHPSDCRWTNRDIEIDPNGDTVGKIFGIGGKFGLGTYQSGADSRFIGTLYDAWHA